MKNVEAAVNAAAPVNDKEYLTYSVNVYDEYFIVIDPLGVPSNGLPLDELDNVVWAIDSAHELFLVIVVDHRER